MPTPTAFDASLPLLAQTLTLTAALLAAWHHEGQEIAECHLQDALRMDTQRMRYLGIDTVGITI
jgi:hypothetical protein